MVTLGCDLAPGGERCRKGRLSKGRVRLKNMIRRHRILCGYRKSLPRERFRIGKIYAAGVKPGLAFGDAVVGMSDAEFKRARSVMLSWQAPRHAGVPLRAKTALLGDPLWRSMIGPALAWAHAV
eukprot:282538-Pyramimonas_sp.AAC.1